MGTTLTKTEKSRMRPKPGRPAATYAMTLDEFIQHALGGHVTPIRLASIRTICERGRIAWLNRLVDEGKLPHTHLGPLSDFDDGTIDLLA